MLLSDLPETQVTPYSGHMGDTLPHKAEGACRGRSVTSWTSGVEQPANDEKTIVFVSEAIENIPAGWRARETYTVQSDNDFKERFDLAEPGWDFELY
jgi:hypothetical protein